ncbi:MAG: hypothetical protein HZB92_05815 [Euryarchaeota archaeon]|nr:hypothetical protein [Euryarchaeota archaeon]
MNVDEKIVAYMKPLFGDMAERTVGVQKEKLGLTKGELSYDEYKRVVTSIVALCRGMAGDAIARKIEDGLNGIISESRGS